MVALAKNAAGRIAALTDALGYTTTSVYDAASRRIALQDARGNRTTFGYDIAGRQTLMLDAVGNRFTTTYDAAGQPATKQDGRGVLVTYTFDAVGRPTLRNRSDGVLITLGYDAVGNRTLMQDATGSTTYTYDPLSRLVTVVNGASKQIDYGYDSRSLRTSMLDPDGGRFTYTYNDARQISTLAFPFNAPVSWTYDRTRVSSLRRGAGPRTSYTYDALGRVVTVLHSKAAGTPAISQFDYSFDAAGNRTNVVELDGTRVTWTYDATYQLTREQRGGANAYNITHTYDAVGNHLLRVDDTVPNTTFTFDAANQLATWNQPGVVATFTFDAAGNMAGLADDLGDVSTLTWDAENRLILNTANTGNPDTSYAYDGDGRRTRFLQGGSDKRFVWDLQNLLLEANAAGVTQNKYLVEPRAFGNLLGDHPSPSLTRFYLLDGLGNYDRQAPASGGAAGGRIVYEAFGNQVTSFSPIPFAWGAQFGYYNDSLVASVPMPLASNYLLARYYDAVSLFRFLSRDLPELADENGNLYWYVGNNAVNWVDPGGLQQIIYRPGGPIIHPGRGGEMPPLMPIPRPGQGGRPPDDGGWRPVRPIWPIRPLPPPDDGGWRPVKPQPVYPPPVKPRPTQQPPPWWCPQPVEEWQNPQAPLGPIFGPPEPPPAQTGWVWVLRRDANGSETWIRVWVGGTESEGQGNIGWGFSW